MPIAKLTDMTVQKLPPGLYFDEKLPGFGIRVGSHRRTWFAVRGTARRQTTLGHYPAVSLQEARRRAMAALSAPEEEAKASITFPEAKALFLAQDRWRPNSKRVLISTLKHFPWQGPLHKITHGQVLDALDQIAGKSARVHSLKDLRTLFRWCVPRYLSVSPADGIRAQRLKSRDRVLTDDELRQVWMACGEVGIFGDIVRLLILTGQRRTEIGSLEYAWIKSDRITWPAPATKNGREHSVPLGRAVSSILRQQAGDAVYVFPARVRSGQLESRPFVGWSTGLENLHSASRTSGWTLHDLRRTFATGLARQGTAIHVTEKILNHVSGALGGVAGIYNRFAYWDDQVKALDQWEQYVVSLAASPQPPSSVGDFKRARPDTQYLEYARTPSLE